MILPVDKRLDRGREHRVFGANETLRHLPFFEDVATHDEHESAWKAATAGLVTLRLVDKWIEEGAQAVVAESWNLRSVLGAIGQMDEGLPTRAILGSVVTAMQAAKKAAAVHDVMPRVLAYGRALEFEAKWKLAVDVYDTVIAHTHPIEECDIAITAHLQRGFCLRMLGEFEQAQTAYATAGSVAERTRDMVGVLRARIGDAKIAVARGNLPYAESVLDETIASALAHGATAVRSRALHDRAMVAGMRGNYELSIQLAYEALADSDSASERDRILSDIGTAFHYLGIRSAARDAFLVLSATAQEQYMRWMASIALMTIAAEDGVEPVFEQLRRSLAALPLPPDLETEYYIHLGKAHRELGRDDLSNIALGKAIQLAEHFGFNALLFEAEDLVAAGRRGRRWPPEEAAIPASIADVAESIRGLRELAKV